MNYWLFKSEPSCFSIDDLENVSIEPWDGVRNYQARNYMRDLCKLKDKVLFYHSSCKIPAVVGLAEVVKESYPDHTAFDPNSDHPDLTSDPENPRWFMVDVQFKEKFNRPVSLTEMKNYEELTDMPLLRKGNRLSVFPITVAHFNFVLKLSHQS